MRRVFYRYIRPVVFDEKRLELITQPNGGICLRFEEHTELFLWFTYARCHPQDHFNKSVAKRVADERAETARSDERIIRLSGQLPNTQNTDTLVEAVVRRCRAFNASDSPLINHYLSIEWAGFAEALETMYNANIAEVERGEIWKQVVHNMFRNSYERMSR